VLLLGDPSRRKTPVINAITRPLEKHQADLRLVFEAQLREYKKAADKRDEPVPPPRFVISDITIEKMGDLLSRTPRGLLAKRDEFAGLIGAMEKYNTARGASADRAFWLQAYDGGPYTIDRVVRGETFISNLSISLIGGIQPARLAELHGLTSDGLLQRFVPVVMASTQFALDRPADDEAYGNLIHKLLAAQPQRLVMTDAALAVMTDLRQHLHEVEQTSGGLATGFQAFVGKLHGIAGRLALILHLATYPEKSKGPVQEKTAQDVGRLVIDLILPHAFVFYRTAEAAAGGDRLQRLASYILTSGKPRIVASDLTSNVADLRGLTVEELNERLSPLLAGGWLDPVEPKLFRANRAWNVRPEVFTALEQRARQEAARKAALGKLMGASRKGSSSKE
jgi:hypothetical protein